MKLLLIAVLAFLASAYAVEETQEDHDYVWIPDGNGVPHLVDLKEKFELTKAEIERNIDGVTFNLYTRKNPTDGQVLVLNQIKTVRNSNFDRKRPTRVITHGWTNNQFNDACVLPRDAYLAVGDYNVIVVDWSVISTQSYLSASNQVPDVGRRISAFLNFLNEQAGLDFATTITVGHSLGGHIAGIAGHGVNGDLLGVVSLDPALPGFYLARAGAGIHPDDAIHVQVIHTNGGQLGLMRTAGKTDFYVNGGRNQRGCGLDVTGICAHARAFYFFTESILNPTGFRAKGLLVSDVFMGGRTLTNRTGSFRLNTAASSPFALG